MQGFPDEIRDYDFLPDPFETIMHLTLKNKNLAMEDCIHFVGAMVELFPNAKTICVTTSFAIIKIEVLYFFSLQHIDVALFWQKQVMIINESELQ